VEPAADSVREHHSEAGREPKPLADQQALYNGFGNALAQAVEFAATPLIFFLAGRWADHRFGTTPVFAVVLFVAALVGVSVSAYYR
jgi:Putative F0F1-ATPase subunit Ca2+/Mg2+ transporter